MKTLDIKTKQGFLQDMLNYYLVNPTERRSKGANNGCKYNPISAKKYHSQGCAIGRHLDTELKNKLDNALNTAVDNEKIFNQLPSWMKDLGMPFLEKIQTLHDFDGCWTEKGLSEDGIKRVKSICDKNGIDFNEIEIPLVLE